MKIALDARWIFPEISGIGAYTRELIGHLSRLDQENEYVLIFNSAELRDRTLQETRALENGNFRAALVPHGIFAPGGQISIPRLLKAEAIDLYHSTNYMIPLLAFPRGRKGKRACVVTIHDVIPLLFPEHAPRSKKTRLLPIYKALMKEIGARADAIITDSQSSARDIIRTMAIPNRDESKIHVAYCGVADRFFPGDVAAPKTETDLRQILFVGRMDPYKNLKLLVEAFADASSRLPFPTELVVAGPPDPRYPDAEETASGLGIRDRVRWTGYLSDDALARCYRDADLLVHPSRYEGFGLQVAEAMASGLPVICSNAGSLPEVGEDAAILVSPDDREALAHHIIDVLGHPERAAEMRVKGLERAKRFTWKRTAEAVLSTYNEVLS
jgi:glycosyltransferase involved in cell wall biosynthesis